ncbi:hypothetical protein [Streptomyces sp. NPDC051132]
MATKLVARAVLPGYWLRSLMGYDDRLLRGYKAVGQWLRTLLG